MAREITILLVDDEPTILRALQTALESHGYVVSSVMNGEQAVARTASIAPDLVLLDLGLPGIDGFEVLRRIRTFAPTLPIIVVSAHGDDTSKVRALDRGADDYVSKPFSVPELLARVRTALRHGERAAPLEATVIERGQIRIDLLRREAAVGDRPLTLTPTQFDLLVCFARHPNRVLTHRMIAAEVWGDPDAAESTNIRVFVSQLRRRLDTGGETSQIVTEAGVGYRFVPRPS
ncbi:MAG: hypothetical protein QOE98_1279 [Gaiellaceae bacterium]|nr:hypothetical protein [Gaiellaceae bacterium]